MSAELLMVEQRGGHRDGAPWILEGGRRLPGMDDRQRIAELRNGLVCHAGVRSCGADAEMEEVEQTLAELHEHEYLQTLREIKSEEPVVMPELAAPGLPPDVPVSARLVAAAHEGVRTAISAANRLLEGDRFAYALCRPPGHHAGPDWFAGYCYLNSAAAAALTLRDGGKEPVGILDLDLHYPNGTAALIERIDGATLHSLHAAPVTNVAPGTVLPQTEGERALAFAESPDEETYAAEVADSVAALAAEAQALVVSLGYDTVGGDPHGSWSFTPAIFTEIGALLAASGLPVCVIQEGGYSLPALAACSHAFATGLLGDGRR